MTEIKVLGTGTSRHKMVSTVLKEYLTKAGLPLVVHDYTDIDSFIKDGIESVPAVIYDNKVFNIEANGSFSRSLRKAVSSILRESNYGHIEKVVIPVDFSDVSTNAFAYGHRLATDLGAVTKAVHVYYPSAREVTEATAIDVDFAALKESYLEDFVATFDSDWGSDLMRVSLIDSEFKTGFAADEILNSIEDNAAFITVMGTTGQSGILKKWFGSVSTRIMNESPSPVLLIPEEASYRGINTIAYAYENIDQDKAVMEDLALMAIRLGADIHLVHIEDGGNPDPGYYLTEVLSKYFDESKITTSSVVSSDVSKGLSQYCIDQKVDVLSLSTHKKKFFEKLLDDNISRQMSIVSAVPLLVFKA